MPQSFAYNYSYSYNGTHNNNSAISNHPPPPSPYMTSGVFSARPEPPLIPGSKSRITATSSENNEEPESKRPRVSSYSGSSWRCDACDLELDSELALKAHIKSHVKCSSCSFEAAPRVVKGHFQGVHGKFSGSGFKTVTLAIPGCRVQRYKICVGNRPEDIQRWIAERRKRFPRREPPQQQENVSDKSDSSKNQEKKSAAQGQKSDEKVGLSSLLDGYGSSSDSDHAEGIKPTESKMPDTRSAADEESKAASGDKSNDGPLNKRFSKPCRFFIRTGTCRNGDACRFSHDATQAMGADRRSPKRGKESSSSSSATLLRKLLANDVRRETTLGIQLLKYIVDCNYLQEQKSVVERQDS
jgi:hypothetical protein